VIIDVSLLHNRGYHDFVTQAPLEERTMQQVVLEIKSHFRELPKARDFVREFCCRNAQWSFDEEDICHLELAVHEAAVNIIRHAYANRIDQRIVIEAHWFDDKLIFRLNYWGQSFDRDSVPPPVLDGTAEAGFGLHMIDCCVDEATYIQSEKGKKTVCLIKQKKTPESCVREAEEVNI